MVHQYKNLCFACHYSVLVSLLFLRKINCLNATVPTLSRYFFCQPHSSAVVDSCLFIHSKEIVNFFQQLLPFLNTQLRDRTHEVHH